jgi:hypothetical protein
VDESRHGTAEFWAGPDRLLIDFDSAGVMVNDVEVPLTPTQYRILACLARHAGRVVSVEDLTAEVWGEWYGSGDHVFVYIHHIRDRLGPCGRLIRTRRTMGYLLQGDPLPEGEPGGAMPRLDGRRLDGRRLDGRGTYLLSFDLDSLLLAIEPNGEFLGWEASQILGTRFAIEGIDVEAISRLAQSLVESGDGIFTGPNSIGHADGRRIGVTATVRITLTDGVRTGYAIEVSVDGD